MDKQIADLEARVAAIEKRNHRVERHKTFEHSWTRRIFVSIMTYFFAAGILSAIGNSTPWESAFVPVAGFILSTISLASIEQVWKQRIYERAEAAAAARQAAHEKKQVQK
jgi:hypothetical protein